MSTDFLPQVQVAEYTLVLVLLLGLNQQMNSLIPLAQRKRERCR
jgi:hypothetical protein